MNKKSLPIVCAVFLVIAMTVQFIVSYSREKTELMQQMESKMDLAQKDFLFEVYDMHEATDEITHFFPEFETNTNDLYALLETVLGHYPDLYCCYVTFLPECAPVPGQWCCPTAFRVMRDSIVSYDAKGTILYAERDWYIGALKSEEKGYWSLPYNDGTHEDPVFTYSQKVYDSHGKLVGVAGADCTLAWTAKLLEDIKPYDDAVCQLLSNDGTLIVGCGHTADIRDRIVFEKVLSPTDMRLVISVPKCHIRKGITGVSLITLSVLLTGILVLGLLLQHIRKEQEAFTRIEMANKVIEKEMQIAHDIQMGILKGEDEERNAEQNGDVELHARLFPMREVGGDLYDFHRQGDKLWFIIGDVSGKGVPAAMFMSAAVNLFRAAGARSDSPREIMEKMNAVLSENNPSFIFVTAFIGRLHVPTGELLYCNAGHCAPIIKSQDAGVRSLEIVPNIPLGYNGHYLFIEQGCMLGQGETIVLYTDGITEARNTQRQMLGLKCWKQIVEGGNGHVSGLLNKVKTFIGTAEQTDDITLMTIRKTGVVEPLNLRVENRMDCWPQLRAALHTYGLCAGMETRTLKKTELAVEEAVVNIVNYSQAEWMELDLDLKSSNLQTKPAGLKLAISLRDNGVPFDPTQQAEVDTERATAERQIGGLGITLLRKIADEVRYNRIEDINTLTIIKQL